MPSKLMQLINNLYPISGKMSAKQKFCQSMACGIIGAFGKTFMKRHSVTIHNYERLHKAVFNRPPGVGLFSVCNHACNVDDYLLWCHILSYKDLFNPSVVRWTAVASDICFKNISFTYFFACGKTVPMTRNVRDRDTGELLIQGAGVYQPGVEFLISQLNQGNWVNYFPQGRVIYEEEVEKEKSIRFKWGAGRIIETVEHMPIILPIWHCGFETINPMNRPYWLYLLWNFIVGRKVTVFVGEPIRLQGYLQQLRNNEYSPREIRRLLTGKIHEKMMLLKDITENLHRKS